MAGCDFSVFLCMLHLRATTSEGCGGTRTGSRQPVLPGEPKESPSPPRWASRSCFRFPTAGSCCVHVLHMALQEPKRLTHCPPASWETQMLLQCLSFCEKFTEVTSFGFTGLPRNGKHTKSQCGFAIPPSTSGRLQQQLRQLWKDFSVT